MTSIENDTESGLSSDNEVSAGRLSLTSSVGLEEFIDDELDYEDTVDMMQMYSMDDEFDELMERRYHWPEGLSSSVCDGCSGIFADPKDTKALLEGKELSFSKTYYEESCPLCYLLRGRATPGANTVLRVNKLLNGSSLLSEVQFAADFAADTIEILGPLDHDTSSIFENQAINRDFKSSACFSRARQWIRECRENHKICRRHSIDSHLPSMPTRVIDVSDPSRSFLHVAKEGEGKDYVALSYCWGGGQPFKTTTTNFKQYCNSLPYSALPQTIKDAITCAHKLGIQYLWIDSLCIIQDDAQDVAAELQKMANIYKYATVTIAAANAENCTQGFLEERIASTLEFTAPFALPDDGTVIDVVLRDPDNGRWREPLWERAWTFQEMMLSTRVLIYGAKQLYWKCQEQFFSDGGGADWDEYCHRTSISTMLSLRAVPRDENGLTGSPAMIEKRTEWITAVRDYTSRKITAPTDKLPAISAVAREMGYWGTNDYLAGLWSDSLLDDIMWKVARQETPPEVMPYRAPSWSWASVYGTVEYENPEEAMYDGHTEQHYNMFRRHLATVVDWEILPAALGDPYGQISDGTLRILGKAKAANMAYMSGFVASIVADTAPQSSSTDGSECEMLVSVTLDGPKEVRTNYRQPPPREVRGTSLLVLCLTIQQRGRSADQAFAQGLVLKEVKIEGVGTVHQRIGVFEALDAQESAFFDDAELQTVTIL